MAQPVTKLSPTAFTEIERRLLLQSGKLLHGCRCCTAQSRQRAVHADEPAPLAYAQNIQTPLLVIDWQVAPVCVPFSDQHAHPLRAGLSFFASGLLAGEADRERDRERVRDLQQ